ncbi:TPA: GTP-binding protein [Candidatus Woesearchaeota archaeon]|nr:GTP-binding protein [Candidatus Woesearchaeota archaeon]
MTHKHVAAGTEKGSPRLSDRIAELEDELRNTKYNKRTQHHIGLVKARLARLRERQQARSKPASEGFAVKKSGDATVILVGLPSVGKSTLLNALTNAQSKTAAYAFTTLSVIPGLLEYKHAKIQVLDVPGIVEGAASGSGRGREVLGVVRSSDLALLIMDVFHPEQVDVLRKELNNSGVRLDQQRPDVKIMPRPRGGITVSSTARLTMIDERTIKDVLSEFRLNNADVLIREDISVDQLIDVVEDRCIYMPSITVVTKIDLVDQKALANAGLIRPDLMVSGEKGTNIGVLKELIFSRLNLIRLYCKEIGKKPDLDVPMIMRRNSTIRSMCDRLHRDFAKRFRFARIWGRSAKFPGQKKGIEHVLADGDIVEIHTR